MEPRYYIYECTNGDIHIQDRITGEQLCQSTTWKIAEKIIKALNLL